MGLANAIVNLAFGFSLGAIAVADTFRSVGMCLRMGYVRRMALTP
ncbi:MAG: hypothetical protein R3B95_07110 [Nitrospirales bacterium]